MLYEYYVQSALMLCHSCSCSLVLSVLSSRLAYSYRPYISVANESVFVVSQLVTACHTSLSDHEHDIPQGMQSPVRANAKCFQLPVSAKRHVTHQRAQVTTTACSCQTQGTQQVAKG